MTRPTVAGIIPLYYDAVNHRLRGKREHRAHFLLDAYPLFEWLPISEQRALVALAYLHLETHGGLHAPGEISELAHTHLPSENTA